MNIEIEKIQIRKNETKTAKLNRIYVWCGNVVIENLLGERRPYNLYKEKLIPLLEKHLEVSNIVKENKWRWSDRCGCSCGCSPGFIGDIKTDSPTDIHVTIKISNNE